MLLPKSKRLRKKLQNFLLGIVLGYLSSSFLFSTIEIKKCERNHVRVRADNVRQVEESVVNKPRDPDAKIFVGIMSTEDFIPNRMRTALHTWIPAGKWTVRVYADVPRDALDPHNSERNQNIISVVGLPGVDDHAYPPQKKSFMLLRDMFDSNNNALDYDWYIRVDDDSYVSYNRLRSLLAKLDPNQPIFIGKPGFGKDEDDFIEEGMTYYQGGLGMIFSRKLIQELRPHLQTCISNMLSPHEDIEIGRCVWRHTTARYTVAFDTYSLFYQSFSKEGKRVNVESVPDAVLPRVITLHPNKEASLTYKLHRFMRTADIKERLLDLYSLTYELQLAESIKKTFLLLMPQNKAVRIKKRSIDEEDVGEKSSHLPGYFSEKGGFHSLISNVSRLHSSSLSSIVDGESWGFFTKSEIIFSTKDEALGYAKLGGKYRYEFRTILTNMLKRVYDGGHVFSCLEFTSTSFKTLSEHVKFTHGYFRMLPDRGVQVILSFKRLKPTSKPMSACVLSATMGYRFTFASDEGTAIETEVRNSPNVLINKDKRLPALINNAGHGSSDIMCFVKQDGTGLVKSNKVNDVLIIPFKSVDPELILKQLSLLDHSISCFNSLKTILIFKGLTSVDFTKPVFKEVEQKYSNVEVVAKPKWPNQLLKSGVEYVNKNLKHLSEFTKVLFAFPGVKITSLFIGECHKWVVNDNDIWLPIINASLPTMHKTCNNKTPVNIIDADVSRQKIYDSDSWMTDFYGIGCGHLSGMKNLFDLNQKFNIEDNGIADEGVRGLKVIRHNIHHKYAHTFPSTSYALSYLLKDDKSTSRTKMYEKLKFVELCTKR